jgi:hypothetical protein
VSAEAFLTSIVEVAIGLAGFAGIIAAVRQGRVSRWPLASRLLLEMLLVGSASAIGFALLPFVLAEAQIPEPRIWWIGSVAILIWQSSLAVFRTVQFRRGGEVRRMSPVVLIWLVGIISTQVLNLFLSTAWPYLIGVLGFLGNAFFFFWMLLFDDSLDASPDA